MEGINKNAPSLKYFCLWEGRIMRIEWKNIFASADGMYLLQHWMKAKSFSDICLLFLFQLSFSFLHIYIYKCSFHYLSLPLITFHIHPPSLPCTNDEPWMLCGSFRLISSRSVLFRRPVPGRARAQLASIFDSNTLKQYPVPYIAKSRFNELLGILSRVRKCLTTSRSGNSGIYYTSTI